MPTPGQQCSFCGFGAIGSDGYRRCVQKRPIAQTAVADKWRRVDDAEWCGAYNGFPPPAGQNCGNCYFGFTGADGYLRCCADAPTTATEPADKWAIVDPSEWCGDYAASAPVPPFANWLDVPATPAAMFGSFTTANAKARVSFGFNIVEFWAELNSVTVGSANTGVIVVPSILFPKPKQVSTPCASMVVRSDLNVVTGFGSVIAPGQTIPGYGTVPNPGVILVQGLDSTSFNIDSGTVVHAAGVYEAA